MVKIEQRIVQINLQIFQIAATLQIGKLWNFVVQKIPAMKKFDTITH